MPSNEKPENAANPEPSAPETDSVNLQDLLQGLDMTPKWGTSSSAETRNYAASGGGSRNDRDNRGRRDSRSGGRRDQQRSGRGREGGGQGGGFGKPDANAMRDFKNRRSAPAPRPMLPVEVSFIPERDRLGAVVRQLHAVKRAFPLPYVAGLFLSKPAYHMLKLEARPPRQGEEALQFFQCRKSKAIFLSREALIDYLVRTQLDAFYDAVETETEPPTGNFVCVGRCRRSGVLLGPPNYHGYNERVIEVHRQQFSSMPIDQYRNQIEMVRTPEAIEEWKASCGKQVRYRLKTEPESEATMTRAQVESDFIAHHLDACILSGNKVIVPGPSVKLIEDDRIRQVIDAAWNREDRFPLSLMLALRPAFRRMRLHLFKAGKDETFVTTIPPKPFDAEHAIEAIKNMVHLISEHPGWNRKRLVEKLYPGRSPDDPEIAEQMSPLGWLIDKGHIIEFFNGSYAIPGHLRMQEVVPKEKPQAHDIPEAEASSASTESPVAISHEPVAVATETKEPLDSAEPVVNTEAAIETDQKVEAEKNAPTDQPASD